MPRKKKRLKDQYAEKARKLRSLGYNINYNGNKKAKSTGAYKSAISRYWGKASFYVIRQEKHRQEFHRFRSPKSKREWSRLAPPDTVFPSGVFIQRPKGLKKGQYKVRKNKKGELVFTSKGKTKIKDLVVPLNVTELAVDPKLELEKTLKGKTRPRQLALTVNGFDSEKQQFDDLEAFNRYVENEFIPRLQAAEFDFATWGDKIFGLHLIYSQPGEEKADGEGTRYNFNRGGIFDVASKRVYGTKKFSNRKKYTKKKGKRKGT